MQANNLRQSSFVKRTIIENNKKLSNIQQQKLHYTMHKNCTYNSVAKTLTLNQISI